MKPDEADLLIMAGWADHPRSKIPADVLAAARAGRMPRRQTRADERPVGIFLRTEMHAARVWKARMRKARMA